ncbi:MAG: hypothetical protein ASARMPRED_007233 [Alectoria sarmentosa]|nr:MAG: hypothetical protein ASARMPRED_007233 [Alectoria sarmentosa]
MSARQPRFNQTVLLDTTPLPDSVPKVPEIGASSAPLLSASFFIGARLDDINTNCLEQFRKHWQCLDNNNQQLWHCRRPEQLLNACVFDKLKLEKRIPGAPENETPVHLRNRQIFSHNVSSYREPE